MSENKELNKEELEKVSGGKWYHFNENINWLFCKDVEVNVKLGENTLVEGKVTKRGFIGSYLIFDLYYVESTINTSVNGWYPGEKFSGNTVGIENKASIGDAVTIVAW